jgi:hypothetical protein
MVGVFTDQSTEHSFTPWSVSHSMVGVFTDQLALYAR